MSGAAADVRRAAEELVDAFGRGDLRGYFACFAPDATFLFHTADRLLASRAEYEREWDRWVREDGLRVLDCRTSGTQIRLHGSVAVLTHDVRTTVATARGQDVLVERESIVFRREDDGRWLAVHEHLSADPASRRSS